MSRHLKHAAYHQSLMLHETKDFMRNRPDINAFRSFRGGKINAQNGQPHSLKADVSFSDVTLSWKKPAEALTLQWHDGEDYNGKDGLQNNPEGTIIIYAANKFTADDLKNYVGETVESIKFFEYREVLNASVFIYENGKVVRQQAVDLSNYEKNTWRSTLLAEPYTIPANKEVMFAVKYEYGNTTDLVAICDRSPLNRKGNLYSYDGEKWYDDGPGDFLITAVLRNTATEEPDGYNIYRDGTKVNEAVLTETTEYTLTGESEGKHLYQVAAVYGADEKMSAAMEATTTSVYNVLPGVNSLAASITDLQATLTWSEPLKKGSEMTWSNKTYQTAIGGTATTNTKVWIKQEFDVNDLAAFPNHQIKAINAYIGPENGVTGVTAFIIKNGVIDYYEVVDAEVVKTIQADSWCKFTLQQPYKLELGNTYAFGLYYTQTPKKHPVGIDTSVGVSPKGNSFSISSPSSKGFEQSKPSWKTLASGKISGNFMLTADVEALSSEASQPQEVSAYDVFRDGNKIAESITETTYTDNVDAPGTYTYSVIAKSADGKTSPATALNVNYALPEAYIPPTIIDYDQDGKEISFSWSTSAKELKHYGTPSYLVGFTEDVSMLYGAKFTKEELADYAGYEFKNIKFGIGADIGAFKVQLYDSDNQLLFSKDINQGDVQPGYIYSITLDGTDGVSVPADKDLYLVYNATLPAGTNALILDGGPLVDGGAMVSLTGGTNWLKLGTIASTYNNYNIVIGALIAAPAIQAQTAAAKTDTAGIMLGNMPENILNAEVLTAKVNKLATAEDESFGIQPATPARTKARVAANKPKAKSFRVYCNNQLVRDDASTEYKEVLDKYGVFNYYVTTVYENGWESAASKALTFSNMIAQKSQAPYDLKGETEGNDLKLTWNAADTAPELTYQTGTEDVVAGMTGNGTREGYHVAKFKAAEIADKAGQEVSHIKFKLADNNLLSATVVVMYGNNIVYEQEVDVEDIVIGWNTVRLNNPVKVAAGVDLGVGYHITYSSGLKPMVLDKGPAIPSYGDLISSSGSQGFWYSMKTKFSIDGNWRISAILKKADADIQPNRIKATPANVTYNVYRDGTAVQTGVQGTSCTLTNAAYGSYTVTAVTDDGESAESNAVNYEGTTGITTVTDGAKTTNGNIYGIDGSIVSKDGNTGNLKKGVYIMNGKKFVVK